MSFACCADPPTVICRTVELASAGTGVLRTCRGAMSIDKPSDYVDYLEVHPEEFGFLFDTILINVTAFYRDPAAWDHLTAVALPRILEAKAERAPIRVWTAGCASGEERQAGPLSL